MNTTEELIKQAPLIESKLGYHFRDRTFLTLAFVHRSFINENRNIASHNERLEFLGDSILGLLIADYLYRSLPSNTEGDLSYLRSRIVEASSCILFVQKLDVEKYVLLGKGERMSEGRGRESILADLFEAIIGAIYLDGGIEAAREFVFKNFSNEIAEILKTPLKNWKAVLQDYCQKNYQSAPFYRVIDEIGPDHSKTFTISVTINGEELGRGSGTSKKEAQQSAAADAISRFKSLEPQF